MPNLPNCTITGNELSDLFFNYDHSHFVSSIKAGNDFYSKEADGALLQDAQEFLDLIGKPVTAEELKEDFLARL